MTPSLKTILVADDDADDRDIFQMALAQLDCAADYELRFAKDGLQLLQLVQASQTPPALVFLDLNMPVHNGKECLQELRKTHTAAALPVIILSTSSSQRDIRETHALGANRYIEKPTSIDRTIELLDQCLCADYSDSAPPALEQFFIGNN